MKKIYNTDLDRRENMNNYSQSFNKYYIWLRLGHSFEFWPGVNLTHPFHVQRSTTMNPSSS